MTAFIECGCDWRKYARRKTVVAPTSRYAFGMFVFKNGPHKGEECRVTHRERDLFTVVREDGSSVVVRKRDLQRPNTYEHHQAVKDLKASGETSRFPPLVYILKCNGLYKIGFTATGPDKRISAIQAHNPFEMHLIAVIRGGRGVEAHLHRKFKKYRAKYEWFSLEGTGYRELMDEVRVLGGKQSGRHFDGVKRLVYG